MVLNHSTLERLIGKSQAIETRYLGDGVLSSLVSPQLLRLFPPEGPLDLTLQRPAKSWPGLPGGSYCGTPQMIYVASEEGILYIDRRDLSQQARILAAEATAGLCLEPQGRWLSYFQAEGPDSYSCSLLGMTPDAAPSGRFASIAGVPFAWNWHPTEDLVLALTAPSAVLPWHKSHLLLGRYHLQGSRLTLDSWTELLPPEPASAACLEASFSPCGRYLLGLWRTGDWFQLWTYQLLTGRWTQLTVRSAERARPRRRFDMQNVIWPKVGSLILSLRQERGFFHLEGLDPETGSESAIPLPLQEYSELSQPQVKPEGDGFSILGASAQHPPTLLELNYQQGSWVRRHAYCMAPVNDSLALQPEAISWPSFDGQMVHGLLYRDRRRSGPLPLLMPVHGGPCEQVCATWPIKAQAFVQQGYAVLYVNYRGSWGYGYSYHQALARRWGELEAADILSAIRTLAAAQWIHPQRVALWGGDIGGSSVLKILTQHPELIRAAICVYPICDWNDYAQRCLPMQKAEMDWFLGSSLREERASRSLLPHIHQIQTPLALFHGARDPLVPLQHVETIAASLQNRRVPCWLTVYPEEGHSWQARATLEDYYCKVASFLARFLR